MDKRYPKDIQSGVMEPHNYLFELIWILKLHNNISMLAYRMNAMSSLLDSGNVCCLIFFSLFTLMLLIQSHNQRIKLLVKANLAYSALFRYPCLGNIFILLYYILYYIIIAYFSITELTSDCG